MSRPIHSKFIVIGMIEALSPIHVGGHDTEITSTLKLSRNGQGQLIIPGTSLAGALRAWWRSQVDNDAMWGSGPLEDTHDGFASHLLVEDAVVEDATEVEIRQGVGIDRFFGRASDGIKYEREVLPSGTKLTFEMCCESTDADVPAGFAALIGELTRGNIQIGASQTRGFGYIKLVEHAAFRRGLASSPGILDTLRAIANIKPGSEFELKTEGSTTTERPSIAIEWKPDGPLMVAAAAMRAEQNVSLPLLTGGSKKTLVIPGSSIKGALRTHAERIMATVLDAEPLQDGAATDRFLEQVRRFHLVNVLFGTANARDNTNAGAVWLGRGAIIVRECAGAVIADAELERWLDLDALKKSTSEIRSPKVGTPSHFELASRVAIDRWTGGAADTALFAVMEPWGMAWDHIRIEIDDARLAIPGEGIDGETIRLAALALFHLVLKDFSQGLVPLGFAANRGMGAIRDVKVKWSALPDLKTLGKAWQSYLHLRSSETEHAKPREVGHGR